MKGRFDAWWYDLQDSLWFIPTLCTAAAAGLALLMVQVDQAVGASGQPANEFIFGAGSSGAHQVLAVIAGSMITVAGVVFSITIVALQLASSQFTPRVLRTFTGDRANQLVLGAFIATFTYALLVLRTVREAPSEDAAPFTPYISVTVAIVLALISIGFFIFYINHAAHSIQASVIIDRATNDTFRLINDLFPDEVGLPVNNPAPKSERTAAVPMPIEADHAGYIQAVDADGLFKLSETENVTIRLDLRIGEFVLPGADIAAVWPAERAKKDLTQEVRQRIVIGHERTLHSDLGLGFRQLADIGIKALSPGINDPTTAIMCIDRLAEALIMLAHRREPAHVRTGEDGEARLILPGPPFAQMVDVAFTQMRHFGASDVIVAEHLMTTLGRLHHLTSADHRTPLTLQACALHEAAREQLLIAADVERVALSGQWAPQPEQATPFLVDSAAVGQ